MSDPKAREMWRNIHNGEMACVVGIARVPHPVVEYDCGDGSVRRWALLGIAKTPRWDSCWERVEEATP